jgi:plasmid maintenance system antidote protein VapI
LKSLSGNETVTFRALQARLLGLTNAKIRNGEFSERGLAILLGISQPHLHHVLKGRRKLHAALADVLLEKFQISVTDLLEVDENLVLAREYGWDQPDPELARLRELKKRPGRYRTRDRSAWQAG